jgi:hypothetical protein
MIAGDYVNWRQADRSDGVGVPVVRQRPAIVLRVGQVRALIAVESYAGAVPKVLTRIVPLAQLERRHDERPPFNYARIDAMAG